jgi:hypothetical protein
MRRLYTATNSALLNLAIYCSFAWNAAHAPHWPGFIVNLLFLVLSTCWVPNMIVRTCLANALEHRPEIEVVLWEGPIPWPCAPQIRRRG